MTRLFSILYSMIGTAMAGSGVVLVLTLGRVDTTSILVAAGVGAVLALPVAWLIARNIAG